MNDSEVYLVLPLCDAHNHFQDERLDTVREAALAQLRREGLRRMVVNGSCEQDWPLVLELARTIPEIIPSFGYHPWYIKERSVAWERNLANFLDQTPSAVGEIGLDKWIKDFDLPDQERVFVAQLRLAAERNLPVSIHCLQAWGTLFDLLKAQPRPACGFVLHSFGGPQEMIPALAKLGAYFSLPGYYAHERKAKQRAAFLRVPSDRLLIETDSPDQPLPDQRVRHPLEDPKTGKALNHPANLAAVYSFAAELFNEPIESLASRVQKNFLAVFGEIQRRPSFALA